MTVNPSQFNAHQLSLFDDLPDWPGGTAPKNRQGKSTKPRPSSDLNGARPKVYKIGGIDTEFFTIGELARALNRKPVTIRSWEQRGWLPKVKYRTPPPASEQIPGKPSRGRRLYTRDQVSFLVEAVTRFNLDHPKQADWAGFLKHVKDNWPK